MSERVGENMIIQKKGEKKMFFCIVDLGTITGSLDKFNKTSKT